jgi:hypothetical protein
MAASPILVASAQTGQEHAATVTCPKCNQVNDWANKFCIKCGTPLAGVKETAIRPVTVLQPATLETGMSRTFHLRDGNVVGGTIIAIQGDTDAVIKTVDGDLNIPTCDILAEMVELEKQDETKFIGPVLSEDDYSISVKTPYGVVVVLKRDIQKMDRYFGDRKVTWQEERRRFLSAEDLTDIFTDPTAFPLPPYTVYLSGLSLGYGFTENFMLRSQFGNNFSGDLNLHPFFRFYHRATGTSDLSLALGVKLFDHHPMRAEAARYSHWLVNSKTGARLDEEGAVLVDDVLKDKDEKAFFWASYLVMSQRQSLASGRGKWGWHLGALTNSLALATPELQDTSSYIWDKEFVLPYRVWAAMDYDLTRRLKFLIEVFADNGYKHIGFNDAWNDYFDFGGTPFTLDTQAGNYQPVDLDFGFLWTASDYFRLGVHFQSPYLTFYWKW